MRRKRVRGGPQYGMYIYLNGALGGGGTEVGLPVAYRLNVNRWAPDVIEK